MIYYQKRQWMIDARKKLGLSGLDLARLMGVSDNYIYRIEAGDRTPSQEMAKRIAEVLQIDTVMFYEGVALDDETV
jgi:transcriptional regulator with XRE-family HTH domain